MSPDGGGGSLPENETNSAENLFGIACRSFFLSFFLYGKCFAAALVAAAAAAATAATAVAAAVAPTARRPAVAAVLGLRRVK